MVLLCGVLCGQTGMVAVEARPKGMVGIGRLAVFLYSR